MVDGYYLTLQNDTVKCKIEPRELEVFDKVTIIDSMGKHLTYKANDPNGINGFGFIYNDKKYDYLPKADEQNVFSFYIVLARGPRLNLYDRFRYAADPNGTMIRTDHYLLEDSANNVLTVSNDFLAPFKKPVKRFLHNDVALIDLFDKEVSHFRDLQGFVEKANEPK
jgi:hypothetical protein